MKWNLFSILFFITNAGIWYFGYYYYLDYPLFSGHDEKLVESINNIDDIEKLRSLTNEIFLHTKNSDKDFINLLDAVVNAVIITSLSASLFFSASVVDCFKKNKTKGMD